MEKILAFFIPSFFISSFFSSLFFGGGGLLISLSWILQNPPFFLNFLNSVY
ncbi:membrane protein [Helicobacter pylori oki828]|nr:membrane protein [Helicobacter pylori oki828]